MRPTFAVTVLTLLSACGGGSKTSDDGGTSSASVIIVEAPCVEVDGGIWTATASFPAGFSPQAGDRYTATMCFTDCADAGSVSGSFCLDPAPSEEVTTEGGFPVIPDGSVSFSCNQVKDCASGNVFLQVTE